MEVIDLIDLPDGAEVVGTLYADPSHDYELGDVLTVTLPNGFTMDVRYRQYVGDSDFVVRLYYEFYGNVWHEWDVARPEHVPEGLRQIAESVAPLRRLSWDSQ
jgi:hypothetical protein